MSVKYSFIIPVYNAEQYLSQCVDSILQQSVRDFELLLVDDGSKDTSGQICDEYAEKDSRIKVFHQLNQGPSVARNKGLEKASGEWILFVDADDWLEPHYLSTIDSQLNSNACIDILFFSEVWHFDDGCVNVFSGGENIREGKEDIQSEVVRLIENKSKHPYFGFTWNKAFRREVILSNNIRFIKDLIVREDEVFTMSYAMHARCLKTIYAPIYNYRVIQGSLTRTKKRPEEYFLYANSLVDSLSEDTTKELRDFVNRMGADAIGVGLAQTSNPIKLLGYLPSAIRFCRRHDVRFPIVAYIASLSKRLLGKA